VESRETNIKAITLKEVEQRITRNRSKYEKLIEKIEDDIKKEGLQKGRVRPKRLDEKEVLNKIKE